jgi:sialate O-acetylesterase
MNTSLKGEWAFNSALEPELPVGQEFQNNPTVLYNAMINPLISFKIKGAVWYQGESDVDMAFDYRTLLPLLAYNWREKWQQGDFPLIVVQLPGYGKKESKPSENTKWAVMRESQGKVLDLPNTSLVCAIDLGDVEDLHPQNKKAIATRVTLSANALVYKMNVVSSGPELLKFERKGQGIKVFFRQTSPLSTLDSRPIRGFSIAGKDQKFYWAAATIVNGNEVYLLPSISISSRSNCYTLFLGR